MEEIKRSVCALDCPDCCSLLVTVRDGKAVKVTGDPEHPYTKGFICRKVELYPERVYSPYRVMKPMRRVGKKGDGRFEPVSWDEALDDISGRLRDIIDQWGGEAILPYSYAGTLGLVHRNFPQRFFHNIGASRLDRTICVHTAYAGWEATVGQVIGNDTETASESDFVVLWGCNAVTTNIHLLPILQGARSRGARIISIDPYANRTAKFADEHLMIRPGTDAALALGIMRTLVEEDLIDRDYIEQHTLGFEALEKRLVEYPTGRVSEITGIPSPLIRRLALQYAEARAPFIRIGIGVSRHTNGGMMVRTIACLPGLVGAYHKKGGGAFLSSSAAFGLDKNIVERPDLQPDGKDARILNMCRLGEALNEVDEPPIKALFVYSSNPAAITPQSAKVIEGLQRADLFTVVHEVVFTDTTDYADYVLPAPSFIETGDLFGSYGQYYLQQSEPAIQPVGEAKSNRELFALLAAKMGLEDPALQDSQETVIKDLLAHRGNGKNGIDLNELSDLKGHRIGPGRGENPFQNGFFTPSGKMEFYSESMAQDGMDPLPAHVPLTEGSESEELTGRYPLQLVIPPAHHFLNSSLGDAERCIRGEKRPCLLLHSEDAEARGIEEGVLVRVFNDRGEIYRYAKVGAKTLPRVAVSEGAWWAKLSPGRKGVNQITSERLSDMGRGATFHSNLVQVEKVPASMRADIESNAIPVSV